MKPHSFVKEGALLTCTVGAHYSVVNMDGHRDTLEHVHGLFRDVPAKKHSLSTATDIAFDYLDTCGGHCGSPKRMLVIANERWGADSS